MNESYSNDPKTIRQHWIEMIKSYERISQGRRGNMGLGREKEEVLEYSGSKIDETISILIVLPILVAVHDLPLVAKVKLTLFMYKYMLVSAYTYNLVLVQCARTKYLKNT